MAPSVRVEDVVFAGGLLGLAPVIYGPSLARIAGYDRVSKRLIVRATGLAAVLLCASLFMQARASNVGFARTVWVLFVLLGSLGALVYVTFQNNSFARIPLCLVVFACASWLWISLFVTDNNMKCVKAMRIVLSPKHVLGWSSATLSSR